MAAAENPAEGGGEWSMDEVTWKSSEQLRRGCIRTESRGSTPGSSNERKELSPAIMPASPSPRPRLSVNFRPNVH